MKGFAPHVEVTDPAQLFGHSRTDGLLDKIIRHLSYGNNLQIRGERRAGKSSILRCCVARLKTEGQNIIPVYVNFRDVPFLVGGEAAYRYLTARVHVSVMELHRALFADGVSCAEGKVLLEPEFGESECLDRLGGLKYPAPHVLFQQYVSAIGNAGIRVVLLLDEYEHMTLITFEGRKGAFFPVRTMSTEAVAVGGVPPITYVIAGTLPWEAFRDEIGSHDFNKTAATLPVGPIPLSDFIAMWETCVAGYTDEEQLRIRSAGITVDEAFHVIGGWPAYGKLLGASILVEEVDLGQFYHHQLKSHFTVLWDGLSEKDLGVLRKIVQGRSVSESEATDLVDRGLVRRDDGVYLLNGELWARFVGQILPEEWPQVGARYPLRGIR